ncbi:AsmA-like C-terminal region-containing protein [Pikeienuella sp. HZG-20]|uniref:AsmA-like C-terminal region-containing protein n=1 Tax=Paludibacillus litoralis TaxID=3133267 RepID=UPI0030EB56B0
MSGGSEGAPRPRRAGARYARRAAALLGAVLLVAALAAGGLYLRLISGPVDLGVFLPMIERAASERLPGVRLSVGGARLALSDRDGSVAGLTISDAVLIDDETGPFARVPDISVEFRVSDLISGRFLPDDLILTGISGRLERAPSGAFRFGFGGLSDAAAGDGADAFRRLLEAAATDEPGAEGADALDLELLDTPGRRRLRLRDASILYIDHVSGNTYRADGADLSFRSAGGGVAARMRATLDGGRHGRVSALLRGRLARSGEIRLSAEFENAAPVDIAGQISALDWLAAVDAPVGGAINLTMDREGTLHTLSGRMETGAGRVALGGGAVEPMTSASLGFDYEPETGRFQIGEIALDADRASLRGAGFVQVDRDADGAAEAVVAQLDFTDIGVTAPEFLDAPLAYRAGRLTGRITLEPLLVEIGELRLDRERMRLALTGRLWPEPGEGWRADVAVDGGDFTLDEMMAHWPRQAAPGARDWMRANMDAAHVVDANAVVRLGGAEEELKIDFTFNEAAGSYLRPMPPIRGGSGSGQVDLKRFSLSLDAGRVTPEGGGPLDLAGSTFVIADLDHPQTPGAATIRASGAIADALALIDSEPLALTSALGVPLGEVAGTAKIEAVATLPLLKDLLLEQVEVEVSAALSDVGLLAPQLEQPVTAAALSLRADTQGFELAGDAEVASIPARVEWRETFSPSERSITAQAVMTPEQLRALGVEQSWFTDGRLSVDATLSPGADRTRFNISAGLKDGAFSIPEIDWRKTVGAEGALTAAGALAGRRLTLDSFSLRTGALVAVGAARTDADGVLDSVSLSDFQYRGAVDLAVEAAREGAFWKASVEGPLLDLAGLDDLVDGMIADDGAADEGSAAPPFRIDMKIGVLKVMEDRAFNDVAGFLRRTGRGEVIAEADARLDEGAPVQANLKRGPDGGRMRVRIDDAGRFLRDAKVFDDGSGGVLILRADIAPGDGFRLDGEILVRDIVIHKDAKLEQLLDGAELSELREKMRDDGIVFDDILAPFEYADGVVTLKDAVAKGPSIGVNLSGEYEIDADRLRMNGVFTPLYRLNSAAGRIPLIGKILTGGDGQGVFAFTFSVRGPVEAPRVSVNPLSVLAPGVLRRIFDGAKEVEGGAQEEAPDPRR